MRTLVLSILMVFMATLFSAPSVAVAEVAEPVGPRINVIQIGMNGDDAKHILQQFSDEPLVIDNDRSFKGTVFAGNGGRIRITPDNTLEFIALPDRSMAKLFGSSKLDENFLQQFVNKYNIPRLEMTFVQDYAGMKLYNYTFINQEENWQIVFGVYKTNGVTSVASMTLRMGEAYAFN